MHGVGSIRASLSRMAARADSRRRESQMNFIPSVEDEQLERPLMLSEEDAEPEDPVTEQTDGQAGQQTDGQAGQQAIRQGIQHRRSLQNVWTKRTKLMVTKWMVEQREVNGTERGLAAKAVRHFPQFFRSKDNANIQKALRCWKDHDNFLASMQQEGESYSSHLRQFGVRRKILLKSRGGRGQKRARWVIWLYEEVREQFDRLRKAGVKFSPEVLLTIARNTVLKSTSVEFPPAYVDPRDNKSILSKLNRSWIQCFMDNNNIVLRAQTGKLMVSQRKQEFIERCVAFHLGELKRAFESGELNEDLVENMDETHFVINLNNGKTLGFRGDEAVKYADVVSGGEGMTMVVKVTGGRNAKICAPFMIFTNSTGAYPIRGTPDSIPGVSYRTSRRGFMTQCTFAEWLREPRANLPDIQNRQKVIFLDNFAGHSLTDKVATSLTWLKARLQTFPPNATDLVQPCDSFIIAKIKEAWTKRWEEKKVDLIRNDEWIGDGLAGSSGALKNPGKSYFLRLAVESVQAVNQQRDRHGLSFARKAMIRCGLSLNVDGRWTVEQLSEPLQDIVLKYPDQFSGVPVTEETLINQPTRGARRSTRRGTMGAGDSSMAPAAGTEGNMGAGSSRMVDSDSGEDLH